MRMTYKFPYKEPLYIAVPAMLWAIYCAEVPTFGFQYLATIAGKILTNFVEH